MEAYRLIVALDVSAAAEAQAAVDRLADLDVSFKVGSQLFTAAGPEVVAAMVRRGAKVFLDLKFHDIPSTVEAAARAAARLGAFMLTVHALGGEEMMRAARRGAAAGADEGGFPPPLVVAVTVLTSHTEADLRQALGADVRLDDQVGRLAARAKAAGLDGVVASPREVATVRAACGPAFTIVTPGVRLPGSAADDQRRTMTPAEAIRAGADFLVVGRPILRAADPAAAARAILEDGALG